MSFTTAVHTDVGIKKKTNQDSALIIEARSNVGNALLTVICDGMGGLAKGEVASSAVIQMFSDWFEKEMPTIMQIINPESQIFSSWEKIVFAANDKISNYGKQHGINLGTTLIALLLFNNRYYIVNIGDSRAYSISDNIYRLTKDQTFVQREMDMGRMTPEEAEHSPRRNVLLQCIGASNFIEPDFHTGSYNSGQFFMLCSDGFRHVISDAEIFERLNANTLKNESEMMDNIVYLTELNKYRRELDNITVLLIKVD